MASIPCDDRSINRPDDIIVNVTGTAVCGTNIYLLDGYVPKIEYGNIAGHEYIGNIVRCDPDTGPFEQGDRVVVPLQASGIPEYKCLVGENKNSGHVENHIRIRRDDHVPVKIPYGISDDDALFLADAYPAARMAVDDARIKRGDIVAVWGCGAEALIVIQYAWASGAKRVIAIDDDAERISAARQIEETETINGAEQSPYEAIAAMTKNRGPDCIIDTAGKSSYDERDFIRLIHCCRIGGNISVPASCRNHLDRIPIGVALGRRVSIKIGRYGIHKTLSIPFRQIEDGYLDPCKIRQ